jgi:hypothetical protein
MKSRDIILVDIKPIKYCKITTQTQGMVLIITIPFHYGLNDPLSDLMQWWNSVFFSLVSLWATDVKFMNIENEYWINNKTYKY